MALDNQDQLHQGWQIINAPAVLEQAILHKVHSRFTVRGEVAMPCLPALLDYYRQWLENLFNTLSKPLPPEKQEELHQLLAKKLEDGFRLSPSSMLFFQYESFPYPQVGLSCKLTVINSTVAEEYKVWVETRQPPLFGAFPDAKLMNVVAELGSPDQVRVLDIGAGTGRNSLPLGRLGYRVDAIELTPTFAEQLRTAVAMEKLSINVIEGDVLDPLTRTDTASFQLAIASELVSHFRELEQVQLLMAKVCDFLCSGGLFLFSCFVNVGDYEPDQTVREVAQMGWSSIFTRKELNKIMAELPLTMISEELVFDYEKAHLPPEGWPPTPWYCNWSTGRDIFPLTEGRPPIELKWFLFKKSY